MTLNLEKSLDNGTLYYHAKTAQDRVLMRHFLNSAVPCIPYNEFANLQFLAHLHNVNVEISE